MGDHRATIKIEFHMHGVDRDADMWINWSPESGRGSMDPRIEEFFREATLAAYAKFEEEQYEAQREARERAEEERERNELERLKAKYPDTA